MGCDKVIVLISANGALWGAERGAKKRREHPRIYPLDLYRYSIHAG